MPGFHASITGRISSHRASELAEKRARKEGEAMLHILEATTGTKPAEPKAGPAPIEEDPAEGENKAPDESEEPPEESSAD